MNIKTMSHIYYAVCCHSLNENLFSPFIGFTFLSAAWLRGLRSGLHLAYTHQRKVI